MVTILSRPQCVNNIPKDGDIKALFIYFFIRAFVVSQKYL